MPPRRPALPKFRVVEGQWLVIHQRIVSLELRRHRLDADSQPLSQYYQRLRSKLNAKTGSELDPEAVITAIEHLVGLPANGLHNNALLQTTLENIINGRFAA